jgi:hypothetical protein
MADAAYSNSMTSANNTAISGYVSATGSLLSAAGMFMMPSTSGAFSTKPKARNSYGSYTQSLGYSPGETPSAGTE